MTIRRLNRTEYSYTIRHLLGVDFDAEENFPADDTGYGFSTIGDVVTISPLLMEKYLEAARAIVDKVVPPDGLDFPRRSVSIGGFKPATKSKKTAYKLPFAEAATLRQTVNVDRGGRYAVRFEDVVVAPTKRRRTRPASAFPPMASPSRARSWAGTAITPSCWPARRGWRPASMCCNWKSSPWIRHCRARTS